MKLGLAVGAGFDAGRSAYDQMRERFEMVRLAKQAGLSSICMGEHYLADPHPWFQNIPFLARLTAEAEGMDVIAVVVLSLHHPVEIAEQAATLDIISGGRFRLAIGLGWREAEFKIFKVPKERRVRRYLEQIELVRKCWREKDFTYDGEFYRIEEPVSSLPPLQPDGPPILMGASSEPMARRAARVSDGWIGSAHTPWEGLETIVDSYRDELAKTGRPAPPEMTGLRHCYVAADRQAAIREAGPYVESYYKQFGSWGLFRDVVKGGSEQPDQAEVLRGRVVLGGPDDVAEEFRRYNERFGLDHFLCRIGWPGMENRQVLRAIELLGEKVLPALRD
ncbi:MAG TPA: LLM class flavin-dependent oxidoreductase [Dehalococcoidia bacterium]|nr:LLM class flavin-dependent oxidoreductase [Dehalococcoidia bacterium]